MGAKFAFPTIGLAAAVLAGCGPSTQVVSLQPAQIELSTARVAYGEVAAGESLDKEVVVSNPGDVALGIESIFLSSTESDNSDDANAFELFWDCDDVKTPDLGAVNDAPTPASTSCVIPAGGRLPVTVRFQPRHSGDSHDSLIITTYGEEFHNPDPGDTPLSERVFRDVDVDWKNIGLAGTGYDPTPIPLIIPKDLDLGFVAGGQSNTGYFSIRNAGDGELEVVEVSVDDQNCSPGFLFADGSPRLEMPQTPFVIASDMARVVGVGYLAETERSARCRIRVETRDLNAADPVKTERLTEVLAVVNSGSCPSTEAPRVVIHSPAPGYQHRGMQPLPLELTVFDADESADGLYCKVRSALQGIDDGRPALADCRPAAGNVSGHQVVHVPVDFYVQSGIEVLVVSVTDCSGVTSQASVSVLLNDAPPVTDEDGDGFGTDGEWVDCDDSNPAVYPLAAEVFDGIDNDCDGLIDEDI